MAAKGRRPAELAAVPCCGVPVEMAPSSVGMLCQPACALPACVQVATRITCMLQINQSMLYQSIPGEQHSPRV